MHSRVNRLLFLCMVVLPVGVASSDSTPAAPAAPKKNDPPVAQLEGRVCDPQGKGLPGISILCSYRSGNKGLWYQVDGKNVTTSESGRYSIDAPVGRTYRVSVDSTTCTPARSKEFTLDTAKTIVVDDLVVRLANSGITGRIENGDGTDARDLPFSYRSESRVRRHRYPRGYPRTDADGGFTIENMLPDEPISIWAITGTDTAQFWKGLAPGSENLAFTLDPNRFVKLPPEWAEYGDAEFEATKLAYAEGNAISFSLPDLRGKHTSLSDEQFRGKPVIVNIWGTWCGGCFAELPQLIQLKNEFGKKGLEVVGIAFEHGDEKTQQQTLNEFLQDKHLNYPILLGGSSEPANVESAIKGLKGFSGFPTTIVIDRDGRVTDVLEGQVSETAERSDWQLQRLRATIEKLVATP